MRRTNAWWRWLLVLASMGMVFGTLNNCVADGMRQLADDLDQQAYELGAEPRTLGQWWDSLWHDEDDRSGSRADDLDDWWNDLWD